MPKEIERKFLIKNLDWKKDAKGIFVKQGYIVANEDIAIRIRIVSSKGFITIKGKTENASRDEFEYEIPYSEAVELLSKYCARPLIVKNRYRINIKDDVWEVDEFLEENKGLYVAEIELTDPAVDIEIPEWIGEEVTGDPKYYNASLLNHPYKNWI